ncbi:MAG: tetratricopeptide repeat protein [Alphaproteobacteria bacterium]|nr:tetratricopeptide repeat protein [Alphaproteobacteria bacterium]
MKARHIRPAVVGISLLMIAAAPPSSSTGNTDNNDRLAEQSHICGSGPDDAATIAACTAVISSDRYQGEALAIDYFNRGLHYAKTQHYEEAIADFDQAIKIKPDFANAYFVRGTVKQVMGANEDGAADIAKAKELDPTIAP